MLRRFYRWLVRLHPSAFRKRFGDEMFSIFDESGSDREQARLLTDGVASLVRQWVGRPENWGERVAEPMQCSSSGPVLFTLADYKPRTSSLISGGFVTLILFCAAWLVSEYTWTHPVFMPVMRVQVDTAYSAQPESSAQSPLPLASIPSQQAPLARDLETMPRVESAAPNQLAPLQTDFAAAKRTPVPLTEKGAAAATPILRPEPMANGVAVAQVDRAISPAARPPIGQGVLQSYVGVYAAPNVQIAIADEDGKLMIEISGGPKVALIPVSEMEFLLAGSDDDWIEFLTDEAGAVREVEISQAGRRFRARKSTEKTAKTPQ